jgi:hypothetical protein
MRLRDWRWRHIGRLWLGVALVATVVLIWYSFARPWRFVWLIPYDAGLILRGLLELTRREPVLWVGAFWLPVAALATTAVWLIWRRVPRARALVESRRQGA